MTEMDDKYWRGTAENEPAGEPASTDASLDRRDFLKAAGFMVGASMLAGCQRSPVEKAIPYLAQPEGVVAGRAYWMASVCGGCSAGCGVLVKCRDGRPIKLEGLADHPLSHGGLCAVGQANVLELYDSRRLKRPLSGGRESDWKIVDREVVAKFDAIRAKGGRVRLLTSTLHSPTAQAVIERFLGTFPDARHVAYDALSSSAIAVAHARTHGVRAIPRYRFDRARVLVGLDADFLGTWISPVEFTAGWREGRSLESDPPRMSWHVQIESRMSLTGSNADERIRVRPSDHGALLSRLDDLLAARESGTPVPARNLEGGEVRTQRGALNRIAERLWSARGESLVVCGTQSVDDQILVNRINERLGGYGSTLDLAAPSRQRLGDDAAVAELVDEIRQGRVDALLVAGVNPVYDLPAGDALATSLARVPLVVSFASSHDETSAVATVVCPEPHPLEAWGDAEPVDGIVAVVQPTVNPFGSTRAMLESLARWSGDDRTARELVRATWAERVHPRATGGAGSFDAFWDTTLERGFATVRPRGNSPATFDASVGARPARPVHEPGKFIAVMYSGVGMLDGRHAENPWLQELPDPVSKVTWDNHASFSVAAAARLGVGNGDVVRLTAEGVDPIELPAFVQPGQHDEVVAIALGYGRKGTERFADVGPRWIFRRRTVEPGRRVGVRANGLTLVEDGVWRYERPGVRVEKTGTRKELASTQLHNSLTVPERLAPEGGSVRHAVQETTFAAWTIDHHAGAVEHETLDPGLWAEHPYPTHHWAMAIDLSVCTGCSGCVIACQAENNIPVVGRDEVIREREMHWIRIDRYYAGDGDDVDVVHQPMLCQQCDHAPCESVCPVLATVHSSEGLNQQIYNRCVGTRYCANNCPYKVRRFNWFDYPHEDRLANLVLNPDVTVRSRGVMEKCSFCVQRIQNAKAEAKRETRAVRDGEIQTACQQSCPARAIVFGDLDDPKSRIARVVKDSRHYHVLEELNVRPSVGYLRVVRNRDEEKELT